MTPCKSLATWVVLGAALALPAALQAAGPGDTVCVGIEIQGPGQPVTGQTVPFSATKVVDLSVRAHLNQPLTGPHVLQYRFLTPQKNLYQALDVPVADPGAAAGSRTLAGYPFPVKEKAQQRGTLNRLETTFVEAAFPVGGTAIVANGLYGAWMVSVTLDGGQQPFCAPTKFSIVP